MFRTVESHVANDTNDLAGFARFHHPGGISVPAEDLGRLQRQRADETPAKVMWVAERGVSSALLPPGMGLSFVKKKDLVERYLDSMVVESLVRHLSGVDPASLAPELIGRELVEI